MLKILATVLLWSAGQVPQPAEADARARTIAPFIGPDVVAVMQVDLAHAPLPVPGSFRLRRAGVKEVYVIARVDDVPGPPTVVVPLPPGADANQINLILSGKGGVSLPVAFPSSATIRGAVVAGTSQALDRIRAMEPADRPELAAAFAALGDETIGMRMLLLPSPDIRRVCEELVPELPPELGGGPVTEWTRGIRWVAAGLAGPQLSARLVVATPNEEAARALARRGSPLLAYLAKSPIDVDVSRPLSQLKTEVNSNGIRLSADAAAIASLVSAIRQPVVEANARARCSNNLKQIALAMHNYLASKGRPGHFPAAFSTSKDGKPLLSWRVLILPFLSEEALFHEFHLDEAWDSPHNKALVAKMPALYRCPDESAAAASEGKTRYVAPRGAGTVLRGAEPVELRDITDGTSRTILVIDAGDERAVPWTKPDDWEIGSAPDEAVVQVFHAHPGRQKPGTYTAFADGSVRFFTDRITPARLRALCTRNGGEEIPSEDQ